MAEQNHASSLLLLNKQMQCVPPNIQARDLHAIVDSLLSHSTSNPSATPGSSTLTRPGPCPLSFTPCTSQILSVTQHPLPLLSSSGYFSAQPPEWLLKQILQTFQGIPPHSEKKPKSSNVLHRLRTLSARLSYCSLCACPLDFPSLQHNLRHISSSLCFEYSSPGFLQTSFLSSFNPPFKCQCISEVFPVFQFKIALTPSQHHLRISIILLCFSPEHLSHTGNLFAYFFLIMSLEYRNFHIVLGFFSPMYRQCLKQCQTQKWALEQYLLMNELIYMRYI